MRRSLLLWARDSGIEHTGHPASRRAHSSECEYINLLGLPQQNLTDWVP